MKSQIGPVAKTLGLGWRVTWCLRTLSALLQSARGQTVRIRCSLEKSGSELWIFPHWKCIRAIGKRKCNSSLQFSPDLSQFWPNLKFSQYTVDVLVGGKRFRFDLGRWPRPIKLANKTCPISLISMFLAPKPIVSCSKGLVWQPQPAASRARDGRNSECRPSAVRVEIFDFWHFFVANQKS